MKRIIRFLKKYRIVFSILFGVAAVSYWFCLPDPLFRDPVCTVVLDRKQILLGARIAADGQWRFPALAEATCKQVCAVMGAVPLRSCRLDLMIRRAFIAPDRMDLGITAYVTSCGASPEAASCTLAAALAAIADALSALSTVE